MTDREALIEFARGATAVIAITGVFILLVAISGTPEVTPAEKFKVVDKYRGCDVVRYNRQEEGRYTYFLDCSGR